MLSQPQLRLFSALALLVAATDATWADANIYGRGVEARQEVSGSSSSRPGAAVTSSTSTSEEPTTPTPTPSPTPSSSSVVVFVTPTTTPPSAASSVTPTTSPSAAPSTSASSTPSKTSSTPEQSSSSSATKTAKTTAKVTPTPTTFVVVSTVIRTEGGSTFSSLASSTVTSDLPTSTAELNKDGSPKGDTGMSSKTRSTIIGVVVGIGGAILLAGLGVVAFRIWGRRKNSDENDGLMFGNTGHEKTGSSSAAGPTGASPFTSTLENYHNPARQGNVNASSNF